MDYTDLVKRLRDDYQKTVELCAEAAAAIEAQAARIAELTELADANIIRATNDEIELLRSRIAELEAEIEDAHGLLDTFDVLFHDEDGKELSLKQRLETRVRAARAALEGK